MNRPSAASVVRMILTSIYTLIAVLLQCSVFPRLRLLGAIPEVTFCVVVCCACLEDPRFSCVLAVCAGFVLDTLGSDRYTLSPLLFLLAAAFAVFIKERVYLNGFVKCFAAGSAALLGGALKTFLILIIRGAPAGSVLTHTAIPQFIYGLLILLPVCLLALLHHKTFRPRAEREYRSA